MSLDAVKNFAYTTVLTAPSPATTGLTLVLATGGGALMPAVPFDAVAAPAGAAPLASTSEIITVTAVATDTLTFTRQSQSSTLQSIAAGWTITAGATAKTISDLGRANYNFVVSATGGDYSTLSTALAAATAGSTYFVRGTITETAAIVCSAANVSVIGNTQSTVNLVNQAATCWTMSGANWIIQNLTIVGGITDKGADNVGQMTLSGNYGKISGCFLKEGASATTTFGSFIVIDGQWCEVSGNQFQSMNTGGAMVWRFNPFQRSITVRNNTILNTSGKAFFAYDPTGQTTVEIKGVQILGNNGMMTTGSARYRAIDLNYYANTSCFITGGVITGNEILVLAGDFIGVNGGGATDTGCVISSNVGQGVASSTVCGISAIACSGVVISNNRSSDMLIYNCTQAVISGNSGRAGTLYTNGNQLGAQSVVSGNVFNTINIGRATNATISGNITLGTFSTSNTTGCEIFGNQGGSVTIATDVGSDVYGNTCPGGTFSLTGTTTVEYGNTGSSTSITLSAPKPFTVNSPLAIKSAEIHNWQAKGIGYTMLAGDYGIIATAAITVTLPSAVISGLGYQAEIAPNSFAVTVASTAGTVATTALSGQVSGKYVSDGTNWISR